MTRCCRQPAIVVRGNFVLIVLVAGALGFDVVVADFHHGAHDWRPLVHRANTDGPPLGAVVVIPVDILVHTHVHHVPVVAHGDRTVVEDTQHVTVVVDIVGKFSLSNATPEPCDSPLPCEVIESVAY